MKKEKKLKNYTIGFDSDVEAISMVTMPAVESNFIFFSEQKPIFLEKEDKRMVYGVALRADYPIYRRFEDNEFYVTFTKECIEQLSQKFLKNGFQRNWTTEHEDIAKGISVVESWIKVDAQKDKSIALGLDPNIELGSWIIGAKVENDEVWQQIKDGTFQGFSVEAMCTIDDFDFSKIENNIDKNKEKEMINVELDEQGLLDKIKAIIAEALGNPKAEDEPQVVAEDAAVDVIEEVEEDKKEEEVVEASEETPIVETPVEEIVEEVVATVEEGAETETEVKEDLQAVVDELNAQIEALNAQVEELKAENKKLGSQPSTKPVHMSTDKVDGWEILRQLRESQYGK